MGSAVSRDVEAFRLISLQRRYCPSLHRIRDARKGHAKSQGLRDSIGLSHPPGGSIIVNPGDNRAGGADNSTFHQSAITRPEQPGQH